MVVIGMITNRSSIGRFGFTSNLFIIFITTIHFFIWSLVITFIYNALTNGKNITEYRNAYKNYFISSTFNKIFTDVQYAHDKGMPRTEISETGIMWMGDRYSSNDYTVAKYKGIAFTQADVHIEERHRDSDGDVHYSTIFRGRYVTFELKKKFTKRLLVTSKSFFASIHDKTFRKIELESTEFNKHFSVYAQDGFEAFYLLDPAIMERIEKLNEMNGGKVMVCFYNQKMHIAINNHADSFEPAPVNQPIDEKAEFDKVMNDIKVITDIVDEVRLVK
jgi:hypothetical protein